MALRVVYSYLKRNMPPALSFKLRSLKSGLVDSEMRSLKRLASQFGRPQTCAIDVGANSGLYSGMLAQYFPLVIAIEPNPHCVTYLQSVLPEKCKVIQCAASDTAGTTVLRVPIAGGASETTRGTIAEKNRFSDLKIDGVDEVQVKTGKLDDLIASEIPDGSRISLVKIDVEGHEFTTLKGAKELLTRHRPALYIELESRHGTRTNDVVQYLKELKFSVYAYSSGKYIRDHRFDTVAGFAGNLDDEGSVNLTFFPDN